jgi:Putative adhesin
MADPARASRLSPWGRLVLLSAILVVGSAAALTVWRLASSERRLVSYAVRGTLNGVALDLGDADVVVAGGGQRSSVDVRRTDRFAFDHHAQTRRTVTGGVFRIHSRCPSTVLHSCSVRYRVVVPDNVPVDVRTDRGAVRFLGFRGSARVSARSGDIDVDAFCGFSLQARAESGDIAATASCAPQQLSLRSTTGSVHAVVPPGRYQVTAESASGSRAGRGVARAVDAPFSVDASSSTGDVLVESRRP